MYLHTDQSGEIFYQVRHSPLSEDLKAVHDGRNIFTIGDDGRFKKFREDGTLEDIQTGEIIAEEGVRWTSCKPSEDIVIEDLRNKMLIKLRNIAGFEDKSKSWHDDVHALYLNIFDATTAKDLVELDKQVIAKISDIVSSEGG